MKILVTGFEPFDGQIINPSIEILNRIKDNYNHVVIYKLTVPTVFNESIEIVCKKIDEIHPDIVLMLGQAGGRKEISIERIAINIDDANIPDNRGIKPIDNIIIKYGKPAYFSSLPIKKMMNI
jgi:pyroglutamyl-peptidase